MAQSRIPPSGGNQQNDFVSFTLEGEDFEIRRKPRVENKTSNDNTNHLRCGACGIGISISRREHLLEIQNHYSVCIYNNHQIINAVRLQVGECLRNIYHVPRNTRVYYHFDPINPITNRSNHCSIEPINNIPAGHYSGEIEFHQLRDILVPSIQFYRRKRKKIDSKEKDESKPVSLLSNDKAGVKSTKFKCNQNCMHDKNKCVIKHRKIGRKLEQQKKKIQNNPNITKENKIRFYKRSTIITKNANRIIHHCKDHIKCDCGGKAPVYEDYHSEKVGLKRPFNLENMSDIYEDIMDEIEDQPYFEPGPSVINDEVKINHSKKGKKKVTFKPQKDNPYLSNDNSNEILNIKNQRIQELEFEAKQLINDKLELQRENERIEELLRIKRDDDLYLSNDNSNDVKNPNPYLENLQKGLPPPISYDVRDEIAFEQDLFYYKGKYYNKVNRDLLKESSEWVVELEKSIQLFELQRDEYMKKNEKIIQEQQEQINLSKDQRMELERLIAEAKKESLRLAQSLQDKEDEFKMKLEQARQDRLDNIIEDTKIEMAKNFEMFKQELEQKLKISEELLHQRDEHILHNEQNYKARLQEQTEKYENQLRLLEESQDRLINLRVTEEIKVKEQLLETEMKHRRALELDLNEYKIDRDNLNTRIRNMIIELQTKDDFIRENSEKRHNEFTLELHRMNAQLQKERDERLRLLQEERDEKLRIQAQIKSDKEYNQQLWNEFNRGIKIKAYSYKLLEGTYPTEHGFTICIDWIKEVTDIHEEITTEYRESAKKKMMSYANTTTVGFSKIFVFCSTFSFSGGESWIEGRDVIYKDTKTEKKTFRVAVSVAATVAHERDMRIAYFAPVEIEISGKTSLKYNNEDEIEHFGANLYLPLESRLALHAFNTRTHEHDWKESTPNCKKPIKGDGPSPFLYVEPRSWRKLIVNNHQFVTQHF